jgi:hypothetical protein
MRLKLLFIWLLLMGVLAALVALTGGSLPWWLLPIMVAPAVGLFALFSHVATTVRFARGIHTVTLQLAAGDTDAAAAELADLERQYPKRRSQYCALLQAVIAVRRSEYDSALAIVDEALSWPGLASERFHHADLSTRALRALLLVRVGRVEEALVDAEAVEAAREQVDAMALARAALARTAVAARSGDRGRLVETLQVSRPLMLSALAGRERQLARAVSAMAVKGESSAYRSAAEDDDAAGRDGLVQWVGEMVPKAAPFVRELVLEAAPPSPLPAASAAARVAVNAVHAGRAHAPGTKRNAIVVAIAVVAAAGVVALLAPAGKAVLGGALTVIGGMVLFAVLRYAWERRAWRSMTAVLRRLELGEIEQARVVLVPQTRASSEIRAGAASLYLAATEYAAGELSKALELNERALALLATDVDRVSRRAKAQQGHFSALLHDQARQQRALLLVAAARDKEAVVELETLDAKATEATRFNMGLLRSARAGQFDLVAAMVASRPPDMPLSARAVVMGDVAWVCTGAAVKPQRELLTSELQDMPHIRRWLARVTPELWAAYQGRT